MDIVIRKGTASEVEAFLIFTHQVRDAMAEKAWFALDPDEEMRELTVSGDMEFWLAECGGRLAAVFSIIRPGLREFNLGYETGLEETELLRVVHMDTAAVHPDFRGRGLQRRMMAEAEKTLPGRILLCTIHPDNRYSLENALRLGYRIEKRIAKYGSIRFILRKDA
ncbi:MAG: GNAT family N-acetyltransferase [Oscillospiraceae bacterium]|nr:GNAT family N-acetyltransferase [Oscillospiraceae bacterium]